MKTISEHITDIVQLAIKAKATMIDIMVIEDSIDDFYLIMVNDNGCGVNKKILHHADNMNSNTPAYLRDGNMLPVLNQDSRAANGSFHVHNQPGAGARVKAVFQLSHQFRPPAGDISNTLYLLLAANPGIHLSYSHTTGSGNFSFDSARYNKFLTGTSLLQNEIEDGILNFICTNLDAIKAGR